jgi:hypothetical protein
LQLPNCCQYHSQPLWSSGIKCTWTPFPIYQDVIDPVWAFFPGEVRVCIWMLRWGNTVLLTANFLDAAKFAAFTQSLTLISCELSFPIVDLKMSSLPAFALKSPNKIIIAPRELIGKHPSCSHKLSFTSSLLSSLGACAFRAIILQQPPSVFIYDVLSLINSTLLTADIIFLSTANLSLTDEPHLLLLGKMYNPVPVQWQPFPI